MITPQINKQDILKILEEETILMYYLRSHLAELVLIIFLNLLYLVITLEALVKIHLVKDYRILIG